MNFCERRILLDIRLLIKRKKELESRYYQLNHAEFSELNFIYDTLFLFHSKLKEYRLMIKSS